MKELATKCINDLNIEKGDIPVNITNITEHFNTYLLSLGIKEFQVTTRTVGRTLKANNINRKIVQRYGKDPLVIYFINKAM